MVLALRKAGSDLPSLSLPHLSPLPVTVPTHSLNLKNPILAPSIIIIIFFISPYFPTINSSPNPLYCPCSANLSVSNLLPNPTFLSQRGIGEG